MSAFRRRTTAPGHARTPPEGVKAAPYDAPVPLLSTGIAALDDIMCGGGVLAGSVPVSYTHLTLPTNREV